jgi:hypothetical protein
MKRLVIALIAVFGTIVGTLAIAFPFSTSANAVNPPGNNGTIKIDGVAFDDVPNNEPHVGCTFQVDFYGYDQGDLFATVNFLDWSPTQDAGLSVTSGQGNPSTVFIGGDDNSGGGSTAGLDASETYTLAFTGTPHSQQGFHVKLVINAQGSQGADTKSKVFWVSGCEGPTPTTPPTSEPPTPSTTGS